VNPTVLAWALAQPTGNRWRGLADAYTAGTTRVTFEGRTVEYRSLAEIGQALAAGYATENSAQRRPCITFVRFTRDSNPIW
jgi:hypothetical protein